VTSPTNPDRAWPPPGPPGEGPTPASTWLGVAGSPLGDGLLEWPPDVFALTDVLLDRADAFRFVLSPPPGATWPPNRFTDWGLEVEEAARQWSRRAEDGGGPLPQLVATEWEVLRDGAALPIQRLGDGKEWRICVALLTLHAIADEACAGMFVALDRSEGRCCLYRSRGRELLARTGSLARVHPQLLRVLPKIRTPPTGRASFSRYACVHGGGIETTWHKLPARHSGTDPQTEHFQVLLLPWPLRVRSSDFRAVPGSVQRLSNEPFGFFEFDPKEQIDLDLLDRVLLAALDEVDSIDVVALPESALDESDIAPLEAVLDRHGVIYLQAGVRGRGQRPGAFGGNWVHIGVNPRLDKGGPPTDTSCESWFHIRQDKLHRWSLDEAQILQYNLGAALHPDIQWWEAMEVPRRSVQFIQIGEEVTIVSLVCEDLAQDDVAQVIRSVGPSVVCAVLLDGPQLSSRWGARYASVLADDPGSGVLTLTSFGMAQRSRAAGQETSRVIARWKDSVGGAREISLEPGAHGVVLTMSGKPTTRRSADGRWPVQTGTYFYDVAVNQITASDVGSGFSESLPAISSPVVLEVSDLTILTGWAEGLAEALAHAPAQAPSLLADAQAGASWRKDFGLSEPSPQLSRAMEAVGRTLAAATSPGEMASIDDLLDSVRDHGASGGDLDTLVHRVLRSTAEQLRSRQAMVGDDG
jgi:hypothetical protein